MAALGSPPSSEMGEEVEKKRSCNSVMPSKTASAGTSTPGSRCNSNSKISAFAGKSFLLNNPPVVGADGELVRIGKAVTQSLLPILDSRYKKLKLLQLEEEIRDLKNRLKLAARAAKSSKVIFQAPLSREG